MRLFVLAVAPFLCSSFLVYHPLSSYQLRASSDDDAPPEIKGDWKDFRAKLMTSLPTTEDAASNSVDSDDPSTKERLAHISGLNMKKLKSQSVALHSELSEALSSKASPIFVTGEAELGGVVARMPLPFEVWSGGREFINRNKRAKLRGDDGANAERHDDELYYRAVSRVESMLFPTGEDGKAKESSLDEETKRVVAAAVKTTAVWYKASEKVVNDELNAIALSAMDTKSGEVNDSNLSESQKKFLSKYIKSQEEWEELGVVASHNSVGGVKCSEKGESIVLNINRPLAVGISNTLAKLILKGAYLVGGDEGKISGEVEDDHGSMAQLYDEDYFENFGKGEAQWKTLQRWNKWRSTSNDGVNGARLTSLAFTAHSFFL